MMAKRSKESLLATKTYGNIRVLVSMGYVKQVLKQEDFYDPWFLQIWKEGQIFGLAKRVSREFEIHVRGYVDNTLDAEIEISRDFLEHLSYKAEPYYGYLTSILAKYNIPYQVVRPLPRDPTVLEVPGTLTEWKPIVAGTLALAGIFLFFRWFGGNK